MSTSRSGAEGVKEGDGVDEVEAGVRPRIPPTWWNNIFVTLNWDYGNIRTLEWLLLSLWSVIMFLTITFVALYSDSGGIRKIGEGNLRRPPVSPASCPVLWSLVWISACPAFTDMINNHKSSAVVSGLYHILIQTWSFITTWQTIHSGSSVKWFHRHRQIDKLWCETEIFLSKEGVLNKARFSLFSNHCSP